MPWVMALSFLKMNSHHTFPDYPKALSLNFFFPVRQFLHTTEQMLWISLVQHFQPLRMPKASDGVGNEVERLPGIFQEGLFQHTPTDTKG